MNKEAANKEAKKIYEDWTKKREQKEAEARKNGSWIESGLDSNNHLFIDIDAEAKARLKELSKTIDEG